MLCALNDYITFFIVVKMGIIINEIYLPNMVENIEILGNKGNRDRIMGVSCVRREGGGEMDGAFVIWLTCIANVNI